MAFQLDLFEITSIMVIHLIVSLAIGIILLAKSEIPKKTRITVGIILVLSSAFVFIVFFTYLYLTRAVVT